MNQLYLGAGKIIALWIFLLLLSPSWNLAQDKDKKPQAHPKVDQERVDKAIEKGVAYLKQANLDLLQFGPHQFDPSGLVLLTFVHSGVPEDDPTFKKLLDKALTSELKMTYATVTYAMALEALDRKKYQWRLAQCAQFLVDSQCANGQWTYLGNPVAPEPFNKYKPKEVDTEGSSKESKSGEIKEKEKEGKEGKTTETVKKIRVTKKKQGPPAGDNSNSQYAALGLRVCADAGVEIPRDTLQKAKQWWESQQHKNGGWCYNNNGLEMPDWVAYGSMSVGAMGSLCIYNYLLGNKNFKDNGKIKNGIEWLAQNFRVDENPNMKAHKDYQAATKSPIWHKTFSLYYLYALERAGRFLETETFGTHEWYPEGAEFLLSNQKGDGSWSTGVAQFDFMVSDTCFAILFLRRATRPLKPPDPVDTEK